MSISPRITPVDWKLRCETLQYDHKHEMDRLRLHYERELKDKVIEIRAQLKREYEQQFAEYRDHILEQQRQQLHNLSLSSPHLDHSYGEQVREQVRLAEEYERSDNERRQFLLKQSTDSDELKRLINKLHTEGVQVLTLSELLALRLNGINIAATEDSINSLQKLHEENSFLRSLIANMNVNDNADNIIKCLADVFRCEQERRLSQIRLHPNVNQLEQEIHEMCNYQRDAFAKFFSEDRLQLINERQQTKEQLNYLRTKLDQLKSTQTQSTSNKFHLKFIRCENHRKALVYQKRYLLVLLTGYEDTETYALNEIRRLTGETKSSLYPLTNQFDRMKSIRKVTHHRRSFDYRFRFRYYVRVVIATIRLRRLAKRWAQKLAATK